MITNDFVAEYIDKILVTITDHDKTILYSLNRRYIANIINVRNEILNKKGK